MKKTAKNLVKYVVKGIFYIGVVIIGPFVWIHNKYKKRTHDLKYKNIVDGFTNTMFPDEWMEDLAMTRASICSRCPYAKKSDAMKMIVVDNRTKQVQGMYCDACGCNLSAKVRSNDYCPKGKW